MHETDFELAPAFDFDHSQHSTARIEHVFDLVPLERFAVAYRGATRLVCAADDAPDWVMSCAWDRNALVVETVEGFTMCEGDERRERHWRARLPFGLLPRPFRSWQRMMAAAESAASCECEPQIGDWYFSHTLVAYGIKRVTNWSGTEEPENRRQRELASAYNWVSLLSRWRSKVWFL